MMELTNTTDLLFGWLSSPKEVMDKILTQINHEVFCVYNCYIVNSTENWEDVLLGFLIYDFTQQKGTLLINE